MNYSLGSMVTMVEMMAEWFTFVDDSKLRKSAYFSLSRSGMLMDTRKLKTLLTVLYSLNGLNVFIQ